MPYLRTLVQDFIYVLYFHDDDHKELTEFIARYSKHLSVQVTMMYWWLSNHVILCSGIMRKHYSGIANKLLISDKAASSA